MKTVLATILTLVVILSPAYGEEMKAKPSASPRLSIPSGWKTLALTPDQAIKISAAKAEFDMQIKELRLKIKDLQAKQKETLTKLLTPEQRDQWIQQQLAKAGFAPTK